MLSAVDLGSFLHGNATERQRIAADVDRICQSIGFLIVEDHGVPQHICDNAWLAARAFFDLSVDEKVAAQSPDTACPRGYFPIEQESLGKTLGVVAPPDRKEAFSIGPLVAPDGHDGSPDFDFFYGPNIWPQNPAHLQHALIDYYMAMERLGAQLMQLMAAALEIEFDFFVPFHTHHLSALRTLNYPSFSGELSPGQRRAGAHSDYGTVTILKPDPIVGGLEVRLPSGDWISAPLVADGFIVNIGDLMARWTNDRWVSTLHRVVNPTGNDGAASPRRQSIAYFMNPNDDAEISAIPTCLEDSESPKYPSVSAGGYLMEKFYSAS
ncbi:MAG: isopenicillin N synthase family dioxygenase [Woeseiaceae bacterium]